MIGSMRSLRELYRIGDGPSSSHTIGPGTAARIFLARSPDAAKYRVTLYGSLAATGTGHSTDRVLRESLRPHAAEIVSHPAEQLPLHPNGMRFESLDRDDTVLSEWIAYSVGGGTVRDEERVYEEPPVYPASSMREILAWSEAEGVPLWQYVVRWEGEEIFTCLGEVWKVMQAAVRRGLSQEGCLPGILRLPRKAAGYAAKADASRGLIRSLGKGFAFALAVAEENAAGGRIVTAPTCGSAGVLPAVLMLLKETYNLPREKILRALATAGIIGNLVKTNASVSGAEVGCQGEIGTACAMASGAAAQLLGGTPRQVEYAAEMGMEHHLGLTCDPVAGLVQIPCIERNAMAALRAMDCATYAVYSDGVHKISFDDVVRTMAETGRDLISAYRETSTGGLARMYDRTLPGSGPGEGI